MTSPSTNGILVLHLCIVGLCVVMAASPIDQHATPRTKQLFNLLHTVSRDPHKFLFGQHNPTMYGVQGGHSPYKLSLHNGKMEGWTFTQPMAASNHSDELCDVCSLVQDFPAIVGMDLNSVDKHTGDVSSHLLRRANERGAVLTVSWHHTNPVTGGPFYIKNDHGDVQHSVKRILPGGDHYHNFLSDLDTVADWAKGLQDSQGRPIPVIFRPWHEAGGSWFWWGLHNNAHNTASDIVQLYRTTVEYLRDDKGVHNFLYAFSPNCGYDWTANALYPGDNYVDIVGGDCYMSRSHTPDLMKNVVENAVSLAERADKVAAWTEFGTTLGLEPPHTTFYTHDILQTMVDSTKMTRVAYIMTWYNGGCDSQGQCTVRVPYPGHPAAPDFLHFYNNTHVMFASDVMRYSHGYFD